MAWQVMDFRNYFIAARTFTTVRPAAPRSLLSLETSTKLEQNAPRFRDTIASEIIERMFQACPQRATNFL